MIRTSVQRARILAAMLALAASGCGPGTVRPAPAPTPAAVPRSAPPVQPAAVVEASPKDPVPAAVEVWVSLYEAIAAIPASGTCPQAAADIDRVVGEHAATLALVQDAARGELAGEIDGLFATASPRLQLAVAAIDALAARCAADPDVAMALSRMTAEVPR